MLSVVSNSFWGIFKTDSKERSFRKSVEQIIGAKPGNPLLYQLAFRHTSASKETNIGGFRESNERLAAEHARRRRTNGARMKKAVRQIV